jgi:hypothetical protein
MGVYLTGVHLITVYLINVYLTSVHLMSVHLTSLHLMSVCLTSLHFMSMHLIGMYLMGVHLIDVYFMDVYVSKSKKALGKPPDPPPYKRWSICRDLSCKRRVFAPRDKRSLSASVPMGRPQATTVAQHCCPRSAPGRSPVVCSPLSIHFDPIFRRHSSLPLVL